ASPGFCGPLGRPAPGVADTRRLPTQEAVKRKLQPTRPFPQPLPRRARPYQKSHAEPQRLSLGSRKALGLGLLHGRRLSHGCATLGSNFSDTALELLRALLTRHPTLADLEEAARRLDQYYVPTRYPNGLPGGTPADV